MAVACAVGAVLGLSGANLAGATLAACGAGPADQAEVSPVGVRLGGMVCDQRERAPIPANAAPTDGRAPADGMAPAGAMAPGLAAPGAPFVAIATRHAPTSTKDLPPGVENPVTDRALALVVGWTMLALIGGGLFAGRRPRARRVTGSRR